MLHQDVFELKKKEGLRTLPGSSKYEGNLNLKKKIKKGKTYTQPAWLKKKNTEHTKCVHVMCYYRRLYMLIV